MTAQLEEGFTRIANQILEEISRQKLNGSQFRILLVVWRYTYGFNRKDHEMSLSFFEKATGLGKTQLDRELKNLISGNVLLVTKESTFTSARKIGFNKDFDDWKVDSQRKPWESAKTLTVSENAEEQSAKTLIGGVSENADQERKVFKESIKDISSTTPAAPNPFKLFQIEGFGSLTETIAEKIGDMMDEFSEAWVCEAMKEASYYGKRSLPYVKSILNRYRVSGIDSPWIKKDISKASGGETYDEHGRGNQGGDDYFRQLRGLSE